MYDYHGALEIWLPVSVFHLTSPAVDVEHECIHLGPLCLHSTSPMPHLSQRSPL